jgi:hypothetical protein
MPTLDEIHHCTREMERYRLSNPRTAREFQLYRRLLTERLTPAEKAKLDSDNKISLALR